ncbi:hypothetical protein [Arthrobacter sp. NPDC090010]|uniref:hypothetical protein n=1 Tax=Arthrobacter sp. NPDC090010 TaxID=3363942 RepID=UPI0038270A88
MTSDTTLVLNLTFMGTLMIAALLAGLVLFAGCMALALTGVGRLAYLGVARAVGLFKPATAAAVTDGEPARETSKTGTELEPEWKKAVREADARALAKATDSGVLPTVAKVSNPLQDSTVKAQELLQARPSVKKAAVAASAGAAAVPETTVAPAMTAPPVADRTAWKPGKKSVRQEGIARKNMPGLLRPADQNEERHAKGA